MRRRFAQLASNRFIWATICQTSHQPPVVPPGCAYFGDVYRHAAPKGAIFEDGVCNNWVRWASSQLPDEWKARRERAEKRQSDAAQKRTPGRNEVVQQQQALAPVEAEASETQLSEVVNHPALIITRAIEWGTVILGFEQANKYTVLDQNGDTVALIAEDLSGIGDAVGRQLLRTRRSFTATVFSADGSQVIFRIRRPMYLISSTMYVESGDGHPIGEIQQRWHLYKRNYDLYMNKKQFAAIAGTFLAWEFELKDEQGGTLALIDRNFQGFGKELFTDAGKYVIHFGQQPSEAAKQVTETLQSRTNDKTLPAVTSLGKLRTGVQVIPTFTGNQLVVARELHLSERMLALACAMTIDFDYFSHHSSSSGWITPPLILPMGGSGAGAPEAAGASEGAGAAGDETAGGDTGHPESSDSGEWLDNGEDGGDSGDGFLDGDGDDGGSFWGGISEILRGGSDSF